MSKWTKVSGAGCFEILSLVFEEKSQTVNWSLFRLTFGHQGEQGVRRQFLLTNEGNIVIFLTRCDYVFLIPNERTWFLSPCTIAVLIPLVLVNAILQQGTKSSGLQRTWMEHPGRHHSQLGEQDKMWTTSKRWNTQVCKTVPGAAQLQLLGVEQELEEEQQPAPTLPPSWVLFSFFLLKNCNCQVSCGLPLPSTI